LEAIVARFAKSRGEVRRETTLDELGLSSLERVELLMALEDRFQTTLDEGAYAEARTGGDLEALVQQSRIAVEKMPAHHAAGAGGSASPATLAASTRVERAEPVDFPTWNRRWPAWFLRRISLPTWILPLGRAFAWVKIDGLEHLAALRGPVIFAANH